MTDSRHVALGARRHTTGSESGFRATEQQGIRQNCDMEIMKQGVIHKALTAASEIEGRESGVSGASDGTARVRNVAR